MNDHVAPETTSTKAWVAAAGAAAFAAIGSLVGALDDNVVTAQEWLTALGLALAASGLTGGATWKVTNRPK